MTALKFAELAAKAGFPKGVINILPGSGSVVGNRICNHPDIRKVGFTGSTPVGKAIMESCATSNLKKCSLELGGKSPLIIFNDCDMERAVRQGMMACLFNKGENCIAAGRLFVEESIHDEFVERMIEEVKKLKIGDPLDRATDHGPQNHKAHLLSLIDYVKKGVEEGATLVYGGRHMDEVPGYFFEPAIFTDVEDEMFIAKEESFGPIMIISKFDDGDVEGVLESANDTEYGLASGVFTKDISKALRVADALQAGTCFINTYNKTDVAAPFGGCKQSGFGKRPCSSIFIVLYGNFDERLFDCLTLAFATTQFLRKPEGLKEMLRELRIICGPVYVILMCSGLRFHPILDLTWDLPSWTTRFAVLASVVAAVFFRPDNSQTLKLVFAGSRILDTNNRRRIHGYLMFTGFVLTFTKVLAASMALTPGVFVFAVFFGVLNCVLYLMYKRSRYWR
ncbi:hypothetical protein QZH41_002498 [Actinostola sp. cb2023]|nr:hypothetical protein QZH41_002498 [Actinostola sp. cb2023]